MRLEGPSVLKPGDLGEFTATARDGSGRYDFRFVYAKDDLASSSIETLGRGGDQKTLFLVYDDFESRPHMITVEVKDRDTGQMKITYIRFMVVPPDLTITEFALEGDRVFDPATGRLTAAFRLCILGGEKTPYTIDLEVPGGEVATAQISTAGARPALDAICETLTLVFAFAPGLPLTAIVSVSDAGASAAASASLIVDVPAELAGGISGPSTAVVGDAAAFTAAVSNGRQPYYYQWFARPPGGTPVFVGEDSPDLQYTFAESGSYLITAFVSDADKQQVRLEFTVEVEAPVEFGVTIAVVPAVPSVGQRFTLTAVVTGAPEGVPLRYVWQLGEQDVETDDPTLEIRPDVPGFVNIGVSVMDDQNGVSVGAFHELEIVAIAPLSLSAAGPGEPLEPGDTATFDIDLTGGVTIDETGEDLPYELTVDFGDGAVEDFAIPSPGAFIEHTYADAGRYPVTFTATSSDGQTAAVSISVQIGGVDASLPLGFSATGTLHVILQSEFGVRTRMTYDAPVEYEFHLLADGTVTASATWTGNTYFIECYGLGDDADSPERGEIRRIGSQSYTFNFTGVHSGGAFTLDALDALSAEDTRLIIDASGAYSANTLTGSILLDYLTNVLVGEGSEGEACASLSDIFDFQITSASPIPANE